MLYIVRHGKTEMNSLGVLNGRTDDKLCDEGAQMAIEAGEKLKKVRFDTVFVSPLSRTQDTAKYILSRNLYPVCLTEDERIIEREIGAYTGKRYEEMSLEMRKNFYALDFTAEEYGIESTRSLVERGKDFIEFLRKNYAGKNVLVVTHNGILRAIRYALGEKAVDGNIGILGVDNATVLSYEL